MRKSRRVLTARSLLGTPSVQPQPSGPQSSESRQIAIQTGRLAEASGASNSTASAMRVGRSVTSPGAPVSVDGPGAAGAGAAPVALLPVVRLIWPLLVSEET